MGRAIAPPRAVFVFNGVNGVLHIKYADRGRGRARERISKGCAVGWMCVYVCGAMCVKLDAVIDYGPLSLTAVIWKR